MAIWMILTGDSKALDPVFHAIRDFIGKLTMESPADKVREVSVALTLMAIGDALLGAPLAEALGVHRRVARELALRSEEHTSELQSLMRISYAVFCLKKKNI